MNAQDITSDQPRGSWIESLLAKRQQIDQEIEQAREPVTILFSDIVGYTRYVRTYGDRDGRLLTHKHEQMFTPIIRRHGGVYVKGIGDAIMARFADPVEAVEATCAMLRSLAEHNAVCEARQQVHVRIGVATGRALIEPEDVNGHVVNVSARLCKQAPQDGILVCEETHASLDAYLSCRCVLEAPFAVRGFETDTLRAYRVIWQDNVPVRKPSFSEEFLVLEVISDASKLRLSLHSGGTGQGTVSRYEEIQYDVTVVQSACTRIQHAFMQATLNAGEAHLDMLQDAGKTLFDVLLTADLKKRLSEATAEHLVLQIQDSLVSIPWELLHDGTDFLCRRFCVGRRVQSREQVSVVTRPPVLKPRMSILSCSSPDLPAAEREAERLHERLASHTRVTVAMRKSATHDYLRDQLRRSEIVHYCGHADYVDRQPERSGWRVADGKWTALDVRQMSESKALLPLVVFANACQSGRTEDWGKEEHLYGLARAYLLAGVQHYIGTLWDILDVPGSEFAAAFYDSLLEGQTIGMAVREARKKMSQSRGERSLIWASYVLYGDPTAQVFGVPDVPESSASSPIAETKVVSEHEQQETEQITAAGETRSQLHTHSNKWKAAAGVALLFLLLGIFWAVVHDTPDAPPPKTPPANTTLSLLDELSSRTRDPEYQKRLENQDEWTSRKLSIALLPLAVESDADGAVAIAEMLRADLEQRLSAGCGVQVLERRQLESILAEQNLGSSALADPATLARLGQLRFARFFLSGKVFAEQNMGTYLSFSLFDCETTETVATNMVGGASEPLDITKVVSELSLSNLARKYPMRGRILQVEGEQIFLNIGSDIGVEKEQVFRVLGEAEQRGESRVDFLGEIARGSIREVAPGASMGVLQSEGASLREGFRIEILEQPRG